MPTYGVGCMCVVFRDSRVCASERGHSVLMFPVLGSSVAAQRPAVRAHVSCWFVHATSCPNLCPRCLEHRCGHVVVDKPAEIRPRRGRRHRNWMYPRGVCRPPMASHGINFWTRVQPAVQSEATDTLIASHSSVNNTPRRWKPEPG